MREKIKAMLERSVSEAMNGEKAHKSPTRLETAQQPARKDAFRKIKKFT